MNLLLDALSTLFEQVGEGMAKPEILQIVVPPLWQRWNALSDTDRSLFAVMEAVSSIVRAVGLEFSEYAMPVFTRCLRLIEHTVIIVASTADAGVDPQSIDREFMVTSLDLLSSMAEGFEGHFDALIQNSNFVPLLMEVLKDTDNDVSQVSFGLVGDIAKCAPNQIRQHVAAIVALLCKQMYPVNHVSTSINAVWSIGEISVSLKEELKPFVSEIFDKLIILLQKDNLEKGLRENLAITIGRLAMNNADVISLRLDEFFVKWCTEMQESVFKESDEEKKAAAQGMCFAIMQNPAAVAPHLGYLLMMIFRWKNLNSESELLEFFKSFLRELRDKLHQAHLWQAATSPLPPQLKQDVNTFLQ
uniref:Importin N-terminal domain-containing protein n=1 Tax=Aplanochytrium stocchinoi TaxID=215587 RepID=A0A7S3PKW2_9STRA